MQQAKHSRIWILTVVPILLGFVLQGVVTFSAPLKSAAAYFQQHPLLAQAATPDPTLSHTPRIWMPIIVFQSSAPTLPVAPSATALPTASITPLPAATATSLLTATVQPVSPQSQLRLPLIVHEAAAVQPGVGTPTTSPTPFPTLPPVASPMPLPTAPPTPLAPTASPRPRLIASPTPAVVMGASGDRTLFYGLIILALVTSIAAILLWLYVKWKEAQLVAAPLAAKNTLHRYRLDAAFPDKVALLQACDIAIAIRHLDSNMLTKDDLAAAKPRAKQNYLPTSRPYAQLSVHISAQQCDIIGADSIEFRLYPGDESPVFAFQVSPRIAGFINIIITLKEQDATQAEVPLLTRSLQHLTEKSELKTTSYAIKADLGLFLHKRLQELQEREATQGQAMPPADRMEMETIQQQLADLAA